MKDAPPGAVHCKCKVSSYETNCLQHATTKYLPEANKDQLKQLSNNNYMVNYYASI